MTTSHGEGGGGSLMGCLPKRLCFKRRQQQEPTDVDHDLDGILAFINRKEPTNPALRGDLLPAESKMAAKAHSSKDQAVGGRDERLANMHVVEEIYYLYAGRPPTKGAWRQYDHSTFKAIKMNMAKGTCAQIHLMQHIPSGFLGVMKVIPPNRLFNARAELNVLAACANSPFILQVIDAFSHERTSYIYLEFAPFRTLDDLAQITDGIGSDNCVLFALEILLGIQHLHNNRILHRDIKPENVFLLISGHVKLGDFSASTFIDAKTHKTKGLCCTYVTRPPEVWNYDYYSYAVDVWAFGITIYNIITNTWPIVHASQERQIAHTNRGDVLFGKMFSDDAADLISRALRPKPEERWSVAQLISHHYFQGLKDPFAPPYSPSELLEMYSYSSAVVDDLSLIQDMVAHLP